MNHHYHSNLGAAAAQEEPKLQPRVVILAPLPSRLGLQKLAAEHLRIALAVSSRCSCYKHFTSTNLNKISTNIHKYQQNIHKHPQTSKNINKHTIPNKQTNINKYEQISTSINKSQPMHPVILHQ